MRACIAAVALALGACATGSTLRSGVGDRILKDPPFYAGAPTLPVNVLRVTGALMGRDRRALRIGAEGMLDRRSGILASAAGL